ncbi:16S rRNA (adenine(1518)-N(6)/adenine(1519)-N(6))-dimethyltransferase RsmA [Candidatus Pelagisphaera phototrophica]|uniref:16S rRNA (adenine(1518)-N(6)/adenine(1519)-N(6))- dimethyltransferase RsmA n=1 Tax=Candidatus Pelagisphaera phototrophica TaxID=2684113 RepID=UPI0019F61872|nr:16S rRNA (adenine(1518)-N(6)/adenine(1519)-N(6))-dimethyltransferase RsmA [Candidatus Pelagisphaera phototrophica]QXD32045.1 ribosomal RNA small subunit methyltransferase A [Candidatus Pelagisphaera phototrophica]
MSSPLSPTETRALLESLGHRPVKNLGQNFLIDGNIVRKSLEIAKIEPSDNVIEVGPGLGTLTQALLDAGANVYSIEKDRRLAEHIRKMELSSNGQLNLLEGDAMDFPLAGLPADVSHFKIVANLPYAISTPWMESIINGPTPQSMTLMLQKEAAQRFVAASGTKQFGSISIFLQAAFEVSQSHNVAGSCFYPKPDVGSSLLHLKVRKDPYKFPKSDRTLIRDLFKQRRKQMGSLLRKSSHPKTNEWLKMLNGLSIDLKTRSEQIGIDTWIRLSRS